MSNTVLWQINGYMSNTVLNRPGMPSESISKPLKYLRSVHFRLDDANHVQQRKRLKTSLIKSFQIVKRWNLYCMHVQVMWISCHNAMLIPYTSDYGMDKAGTNSPVCYPIGMRWIG